MSDKKIIVVGAGCSTSQTISGTCTEKTEKPLNYKSSKAVRRQSKTEKPLNYKSSKAVRRQSKTAQRFIDPMHGTLSRIIHVPDGQGGTKSMKMKTAIKKGFVKLK